MASMIMMDGITGLITSRETAASDTLLAFARLAPIAPRASLQFRRSASRKRLSTQNTRRSARVGCTVFASFVHLARSPRRDAV